MTKNKALSSISQKMKGRMKKTFKLLEKLAKMKMSMKGLIETAFDAFVPRAWLQLAGGDKATEIGWKT